jgi:hypothetical protein
MSSAPRTVAVSEVRAIRYLASMVNVAIFHGRNDLNHLAYIYPDWKSLTTFMQINGYKTVDGLKGTGQ